MLRGYALVRRQHVNVCRQLQGWLVWDGCVNGQSASVTRVSRDITCRADAVAVKKLT